MPIRCRMESYAAAKSAKSIYASTMRNRYSGCFGITAKMSVAGRYKRMRSVTGT